MNLSNIELYYTAPEFIKGDYAIISADDFSHITRVMRHTINDEIYLTDGKGKIFFSRIDEIKKDYLSVKILNSYSYPNTLANIYFCIPKIKSADRFEFALEKCVELGITKFIIYESRRSFKKGDKEGRWKKILVSAMKQSLLSYLPEISTVSSIDEIIKYPGTKIILDQNADNPLTSFKPDNNHSYYFIFGPEGGLTLEELEMVESNNRYKLTSNRLRTETAIITCAAVINTLR
ncbi:MAG: RsmE family RNA methyltransferase [Ignavibacteriaceae bacterium]